MKSERREGLLKRIPLHPFFFAIFPTLALFAWNIKEVDLQVIYRPILISEFGAVLIFILSWLVLRSWLKAGIFTTLTLILFFSYGHIYQLVVPAIGGFWGHHRVLATIYLIVWIGGFISLRRLKGAPVNMTMILNVAILLLLVSPVVTISRAEWLRFSREKAFLISTNETLAENGDSAESPEESIVINSDRFPDIYYIIVDSYVRSDSMMDDFGLDNSAFLDELRAMGFYVADCSRSNYTQTRLSLASSLNMDYLQNISDQLNENNTDKTSVDPYLKKNVVMTSLRNAGYKIVAIQSGITYTEFRDADVFFRFPRNNLLTRSIQPFESMLLNSTAMKILNASPFPAGRELLEKISFPFYDYIEEQRFILDTLDNTASLQGPKFVFAHIFPPHQPFLFKPDGSFTTDPRYFSASFDFPVDEEHYLQGYRDGVEFIDQRLPGIIRTIIATSEQPPVIVLQADHGQRGRNRMMILSAFHFPDGSYADLYPAITPVNSFRVVLKKFLGMDYPLLKDMSWNSTYAEPFSFQEFGEPAETCR